ncbi:hypothetical protein EJO68_34015 [Variovorax atrisoli]|nr:hypothetical protein EJO68_33990 [Variovorax sp. 369]RTD83522.1 hypothetical protein EJO68_34015 [Variovorax sp. 369]
MSGRNCPRPETARRSAAVRGRRRPQAASAARSRGAQPLTARTPCHAEGPSKTALPPLLPSPLSLLIRLPAPSLLRCAFPARTRTPDRQA